MKTINKIENGDFNLSDEEILDLLKIDTGSDEFYRLLSVSNKLSRGKFNKKGYVFTQIGVNAEPCSVNCKFCSLATDHFSIDGRWQKSIEEVKTEVNRLQEYYFDDLFLMTTADYSFEKFIEMGKQVKPMLKVHQEFVANIGDFDTEQAKRLVAAGYTGVYHIVRLREGIDTVAKVEDREKTLEAAQNSGLEIYYCIEPIGPEHSYEEILHEIKRARDLEIAVMAVMRRIAVPGTPLADRGQITASELTKIAAVSNIVVNPKRSMNVHEPTQMSLLAGINQLYAEAGVNPRDTSSETENNRGFTPEKAWEMLWEAGYTK